MNKVIKPELIEALEQAKQFVLFVGNNEAEVMTRNSSANIQYQISKSDITQKLSKFSEDEKRWIDQQCNKWFVEIKKAKKS